ncbi:hypothetical protein BW727_100094 [Jeotgalibaca dankookensis]|uniref:Uncharacterized protein n=1 Tax=Jeotgalibaca dankookensis TaxID=708126 RepID=A0A1S6ILT9_9LACT|nr:hypothetical protein [Jeotgalibaca dankookensis]AQS52504.1 hypothetical protein BW727_100094 [Jeotgalibaca dankookensis]
MIKQPIRNLSSSKTVPERLFDAIVHEDGKVEIEIKQKNNLLKVPWEDILYQIDKAVKHNK